jgi:hydrogenase-4 component B
MDAPNAFLVSALLAFLAGAVSGLATWKRAAAARVVAFGFAVLGSLLLAVAACSALSLSTSITASLPLVTIFPCTVRLDPLSAWFTLALALLGLAVSVYSIEYLRPMEATRNLGALGFFYNALLLGLALVFTAANAFFFLSAWELMAVAGFCLVTFEHEKAEARSAAVVYLIMSHAGTVMVLAAFLLLGAFAGNVDFASFHLLASKLPPAELGAVFLLFFAGFGVKAGIVPLHIWLPDAHPVAPSNVSALMSGIVIKCGIYGMARVFFDFFGPTPLWTGTVVLAVGVVTALVGVLYALQEHDLKRLLAYHSIENIGIIVMGFGAALMFRTLGHLNLAAIAIVGALYHTLNHAIFKGLLFLAAGSVVQSVHTRNMEEMGGLIRRMPRTACFFLIGAIAISGLPPLNGFVSEWLTYQALLAGFGTTHSLTRLMFPIAGSLLALTAALAASCFVLGLGASWIIPVFDPITLQALGVPVSPSLIAHGIALQAGTPQSGTVSPAGIALVFLALAGTAAYLVNRRLRDVRVATGPTWDCGLPGLTSDHEYTATAFSKPLRLIFSAFYRPRREIRPEYEVSPYYPSAIRFESGIEATFEKRLYDPLKDWIFGLSRRMRAIQAGSIHAYLAYIFVTLILLLLFGVRQ